MRILSVLAFVALILASGAIDAKAEDKLAALPESPAANAVTPHASTDTGPYPAGLLAAIGLSELEVQGIRLAIRGQIRALAARDATEAFAHLTPVIQEYFADPSAFERSLVRNAWPILAVQDFTFTSMEREATDAIQHMLLTDTQGRKWDATFKLERQSDGRWAIKSCLVGPVKGPSV